MTCSTVDIRWCCGFVPRKGKRFVPCVKRPSRVIEGKDYCVFHARQLEKKPI